MCANEPEIDSEGQEISSRIQPAVRSTLTPQRCA
jgi:hypothetical protein